MVSKEDYNYLKQDDIVIALSTNAEHALSIDDSELNEPKWRQTEVEEAAREGYLYIVTLASDNNKVIAYFCIDKKCFFKTDFISLLIVKKEYRNKGIGSHILSYVTEKLLPNTKVFTSTNLSNAPMIKTLMKNGYEACGQISALDEEDPELFFVKKQ